MKKYPFKFLDSYNQHDNDMFFGRAEEIEVLYEMVFQNAMLLVYGASGTGKTSLIQCGLAGKFKSYDWLPLTIRRGADINASMEKALNDAGGNDLDDEEAVAGNPAKKLTGLLRLIKGVYLNNFKPLYLIFDQFEEIYVLGTKTEQEKFIESVKEILNAEQPVKMIFSIREEYLGHLYEFEKEVPQLLRKKLRVEPMTPDKVTDVIRGINNFRLSNVRFKTDEIDAITRGIFERLKGKKKTLSVQLPYLQVFLDKLYMETTKDESHQADALISLEALNRTGDIGDVLRNFLDEQVNSISRKLSESNKNVSTETIWKILSPFCTLEGTKEPISKKELASRLPGIDTNLAGESVEAFVNSRILNYSENENLYELAHDSLALRIAEKRSDEEIAILEVQRLIKSQAGVKNEAREFFTEKQLLFIEPYLDKFKQRDEERDWILKSRSHVQNQKESEKKRQGQELARTRKRLRTMYSLLGLAMLALVAAGYFWFNASEKTKIAQANYLNAEAKSIVVYDPSRALRIAEQAMLIHNDSDIIKEEIKIYAENSFYKIIRRNEGKILSAVFSPDAKTVLICSDDKTTRLWGLDGSMIKEFKGNESEVYAVAFSPDGKTILTGCGDKTARLWGMDGKIKMEFKGHGGLVAAVAFSPDGKTVLTGSGDQTARLWDMDGNMKAEFKGHSGLIISVAFSPDGKAILTGSLDRTARLWGLDANMIKVFTGHADYIYSVAFSPDGKTILTGSKDKTARLWGMDGNMIKEFIGHTDHISSVIFSPDGKTILTGSFDQTARLWNLDGKTLKELKGHTDFISSVAFSADGKTILTGSYDSTARLWVLDGNMVQEFKTNESDVYAVAFSPNGKTILTGGEDMVARLWEPNGNIKMEFKGHESYISSVAFSPDGNTILTAAGDKTARLWGLDGNMKKVFTAHADFIYAAAFSPDGKSILTGSRDKTARLWDVNGNMKMEFTGHTGYVTSVAFSPDGKTILTGSGDKTARLWTIDGKMKIAYKGHTGAITSVAISPDGKTILTGSADKTARLWNLDGNTISECKGPTGSVSSVAFSPDGKTVLTGCNTDQTARLWNLHGNMIKEFKGHSDDISSVAFSPDGKTILTGSLDNTARLWDAYCMPLDIFLKNGTIEPLPAALKKHYGIQ